MGAPPPPGPDVEVNGGQSSRNAGDKPVRRITSESAGLLDATEEFIANLKRKTSSSGGAGSSSSSADAMDVLNQLLFAHANNTSKNLSSSGDSPHSPGKGSQTKEVIELRDDASPIDISSDDSPGNSPRNHGSGGGGHHQSSGDGGGSKGKDSRAAEEHGTRATRRLDSADDAFERPERSASDSHSGGGTKRSSDHSSRRSRGDDRYDRYERDRGRDYYDRYEDRYESRYDDRYDRDRYHHDQYGAPPPKRLPLPPPPPPRPRY